jgi:hypothetical protein
MRRCLTCSHPELLGAGPGRSSDCATGWTARELGFDSLHVNRLFFTPSAQAQERTQPPAHWVPGPRPTKPSLVSRLRMGGTGHPLPHTTSWHGHELSTKTACAFSVGTHAGKHPVRTGRLVKCGAVHDVRLPAGML